MQARDQARESEGVRETKKETGLIVSGSVHWAHPTRLVQVQGDRAAVALLNFKKEIETLISPPLSLLKGWSTCSRLEEWRGGVGFDCEQRHQAPSESGLT